MWSMWSSSIVSISAPVFMVFAFSGDEPGVRPVIYYGDRATQEEFPYFAILFSKVKYENGSESDYGVGCGGTLIHESWVVTAAHCLFGKHNTTHTRISLGNTVRNKIPYKEFAVTRVVHPRYNIASNVNDIGLLKLPRPASGNVSRILLSNLDHRSLIGKIGVTAGYGKTERSNSSINLLTTTSLIKSNRHCREVFGGDKINHHMLCAMGKEPGDLSSPSSGDSGGGLVVANENGEMELVGVNSFSTESCGRTGDPVVYTWVRPYLKWIERTIREN